MRPALEVADIFRRHGPAYRQAHAAHLGSTERRVMAAIETCRTPAPGGHVEHCADYGPVRCAYNSCLMGRIRNGELARDRIGIGTVSKRPRSPLRFGLEHRD